MMEEEEGETISTSQTTPLTWEETKEKASAMRTLWKSDFKKLYDCTKGRRDKKLLWGDEIEYMIVKFDEEKRTSKVSLTAREVLKRLTAEGNPSSTCWRPEGGSYMLESSPLQPYGFSDFHLVEESMQARREQCQEVLGEGERLLTLTSFPRLGCSFFSDPYFSPTPDTGITGSLFLPDQIISDTNPRYRTMARNLRCRKGENICINIPIYRDINTDCPFRANLKHLDGRMEAKMAAKDDNIYMDCDIFGVGCCCLQVTILACDLEEARVIYDQLAVIAPIMLAMTAASPLYHGYISDHDARWSVISQAIDDRTLEERGLQPLKENRFVLDRPRCDSIATYLSTSSKLLCDIDFVYDKETHQDLTNAGVDDALALHVAQLLTRDPLLIIRDGADKKDEKSSYNIQNILSTNWQTVRLKLPDAQCGTDAGWRVEFRPMEVQLTDFENAAFAVFIVLLTRVLLTYNLSFLIPLSKVDENMKRAVMRDALRRQKFFFRRDFGKNGSNGVHIDEMSVDTVMNGQGEYPGLILLMKRYMDNTDLDLASLHTIQRYLDFLSKRASGKLKTRAQWIREFVTSHPDYKRDSVISESINYDLLSKCAEISRLQKPTEFDIPCDS